MANRKERKKVCQQLIPMASVVRHREGQTDIKEDKAASSPSLAFALGHTLRIADLRCTTSPDHNVRLVLISHEMSRQQRPANYYKEMVVYAQRAATP